MPKFVLDQGIFKNLRIFRQSFNQVIMVDHSNSWFDDFDDVFCYVIFKCFNYTNS